MAASESDDEDLKAAIAMSLAEVGSEPVTNVANAHSSLVTSKEDHALSTTSFSHIGLDRKAMEAERLARQSRKRERSISPPALGSRKAPKLESNTVSLPSGARLTSFSSLINREQESRKPDTANAASRRMKQPASDDGVKQEPNTTSLHVQGDLQYPHGIVKKTWAFGFERDGNDVKLEEVLEPSSVRTAVLSAFQWDTDWVLSKLKIPPNGGTTKCVFVMQAQDQELRQQMLQQTEDMRSFLRLSFPPMFTPIYCMHSKLMLLFHTNKLRIAVPTANLINFDWGETGVMENSVVMIDLPRLADSGKAKAAELTAFGKEMIYFLEKQQFPQDVRDGVLNFDFSATQSMMFIHTVGGVLRGEDTQRTGLPGLARAVRELGLQTDDDLQIDFAASSIGSLKDDFLQNVHSAARGEDMVARADDTMSKAKTDFFKKGAKKAPPKEQSIRDKLRIYFPTHDTVTSSRAGSVGTICLDRKWFEAATFPKSIFRDYRSTREGLLSHNKILYARGKQKDSDGVVKHVAWAYVGSSNMSESAWGKLGYDKLDRAWKITCRNWECGVLLPVSDERIAEFAPPAKVVKKEKVEGEDSETESEDGGDASKTSADLIDIKVFDGVVPPPFEIPGQRYNGRRPWYFKEAVG